MHSFPIPLFHQDQSTDQPAEAATAVLDAPAVDEPVGETLRKRAVRNEQKPKRQPRYNVILWNDDDHSYDYVIRMLRELFGHTKEKSYELAKEVDTRGKVICMTTTMERAELKRDQIHAYGKDELVATCQGSMSASIEAVPE